MQENKVRIARFQEIKKQWNGFGEFYQKMECAPQSFYFTLMNMLDLTSANNILEIGCGAGLLLPFALELKKNQAKYLATDISEGMIELSRKRIQSILHQHHSQLSVEQWLAKKNCIIRVANGQEPIGESEKFDRILCNMVMMLTESAENMLKNLYNEAKPGCLLGVSVWGDRARSFKFSLLEEALKENGIDPSVNRSNFYLYKKLGDLAETVGWKTVLKWDQTSVFPYLQPSDIEEFINYILQNMPFSQQKKNSIKQSFLNKIAKKFSEKQPILFSAEIYILRKQ